jgi:phosphoglycerate dehydrogenase-like enzyme
VALVTFLDVSAAPTALALRLLAERGLDSVPAEDGGAAAARVLVAGGFAVVGADILDRLPALEIVVRPGAGFERVDLVELRSRGLRLIAARIAADPAVAEWVMGAVIHLVRRFDAGGAAARAGDWAARPALAGRSLAGKTMGIVGVGRIGSQVAALAAGFGMHVIAWHPWSERDLGDHIQRVDTLEELVSRADVVSLHCRLEDGTRGLIGARELARMKADAVLVNAGRGGLVDEEALATALKSGHLEGAAIDTFASEPRTQLSPLVTAPRTLLAPHLSGWTVESVEQLGRWAAAAVADYLDGAGLPSDSVVC